MEMRNDCIPQFPHSAQFIISSGTPLAFLSSSPIQKLQIPIGLTFFFDGLFSCIRRLVEGLVAFVDDDERRSRDEPLATMNRFSIRSFE